MNVAQSQRKPLSIHSAGRPDFTDKPENKELAVDSFDEAGVADHFIDMDDANNLPFNNSERGKLMN